MFLYLLVIYRLEVKKMPNRLAYRNAWTASDLEQASSTMKAHAAAERACINVVPGQSATINIECMKKAVPKGTNASLWSY